MTTWIGRTAVVIPVYGQYDYVRSAVQSLRRTSPAAAVVVVDDASPLGYPEYLPEFVAACGELGVARRLEVNSGVTAAWNAGFMVAVSMRAEHVCLANSDLLFSVGWLEPLVSAADLPGVGLAGPVTNAPGSGLRQQVAGWLPGYQISDCADDIDEVAVGLRRVAAAPVTCGVNGFCMLGRVDRLLPVMFGQTALMNPRHKMVFSEYELQRRMSAAGLRSVVVPQSFVFHYRGITRGLMRSRSDQGAYRR